MWNQNREAINRNMRIHKSSSRNMLRCKAANIWNETVPCSRWGCKILLVLCSYQTCHSTLPLYNSLHLQRLVVTFMYNFSYNFHAQRERERERERVYLLRWQRKAQA
ncbi:hypothetical protein ACE6H2_026394 [Prunus campanulata]